MQGMGVLGERQGHQQKPFAWEECHSALPPKGMWLAGVPREGGSCEAAAV